MWRSRRIWQRGSTAAPSNVFLDDENETALNFFLHPWLLAGTASASIPVIIHLLNRQRYKKVAWAAMHWLWASFKKSRRRLQVEQLLLLIIRTLILLLLALAIARPLLQYGAGLLTGRAALHRVIVLDNSYSMGQQANGKPLFEKAKLAAIELAGQLGTNDSLDVLLTGEGNPEALRDDRLVSSRDLVRKGDVLNTIKNAPLGDGGTNIPRCIAAAARVFSERKMPNQRREIIVITDQTRNAWLRPDRQPRTLDPADQAALSDVLGDTTNKPRIVVMRLHGEAQTDNFAASQIEIDEKVVPAHADKQIVATINSFAPAKRTGLNVKLKVDKEDVRTEILGSISPEKPETVTLRHVFDEPGSHALTIEVESNDILPTDNFAYLAVDVEEQMRVLCVDGQQRAGANASSTDYLKQALSPSKMEEVHAGRMPLYPEVIADSAFPDANLENYRLVILANVAADMLPKEKVQALIQYVKQGGSLVIFCGERVDPALYNRDLGELLPLNLGERVGTGDPTGLAESVNDKQIEHPAIAHFSNLKGLAQLKTFMRFKFVPKAGKADDTVRTVLAYENGAAAALEKRLGLGRVIVFGTSADQTWNNWPGKTAYMPLMNFIALDLITPPYLQRNRMVGQRFTLPLNRGDVGAARREGIRLIDPIGETLTMEINPELAVAESGVVKRAGIYSATIPGETKRQLFFAVNRYVDEGDLATIDDREIQAFIPRNIGDNPAQVFFKGVLQSDISLAGDDVKQVQDELAAKNSGRELWRWFVWVVLFLLVAESLLAKRYGDFNR